MSVRPTDVKKVTLTRSEWNILDASIDHKKRTNPTLAKVLIELRKQVGE